VILAVDRHFGHCRVDCVAYTAMSFDATELISELNAKLMAVRDTIHTTMTKMTVDG